MTGRKSIVGLCTLCALMLSVFAAQSASAAGTTAVTCEKVEKGTGDFSDAHCKEAGGSKEYKHVTFAPNTATQVTGSNTTTGEVRSIWVLKTTIAGLGVVLQAKKVTGGIATVENKESATEMWAEGSGEKIVFEEVTANLGCFFTGLPGGAGKVETRALRGTTKGQGMSLKYEPEVGNFFAEFELSGAECPAALKGKYPVFGSVNGVPNGSTTVFSHAEITAAKSLRLKNAFEGPTVGLDGSTTTLAKDAGNEKTGEWPLAVTTFP